VIESKTVDLLVGSNCVVELYNNTQQEMGRVAAWKEGGW